MSKSLLAKYIRMVLHEDGEARVPNQLLSPDDPESDDDSGDDVEEGVNEYCGAGAAPGYAVPLGGPRNRNKKAGS